MRTVRGLLISIKKRDSHLTVSPAMLPLPASMSVVYKIQVWI